MSEEKIITGKILSHAAPWTERKVPGIQISNELQTFKATFTEPTIECPECHALVTRTAMSFNAYVCPQCDEHLRMRARDRLNWFFDQVNTELGQEFSAKDPLGFVDSKPYPDRMREAQDKTGETEALVVMQGSLKGRRIHRSGPASPQAPTRDNVGPRHLAPPQAPAGRPHGLSPGKRPPPLVAPGGQQGAPPVPT